MRVPWHDDAAVAARDKRIKAVEQCEGKLDKRRFDDEWVKFSKI